MDLMVIRRAMMGTGTSGERVVTGEITPEEPVKLTVPYEIELGKTCNNFFLVTDDSVLGLGYRAVSLLCNSIYLNFETTAGTNSAGNNQWTFGSVVYPETSPNACRITYSGTKAIITLPNVTTNGNGYLANVTYRWYAW